MAKVGRPKGSKNKHKKEVSEKGKNVGLRIDLDILDYLYSIPNKNRYINNLIRKDMEEQMNIKQEENIMGTMNAYNFEEKGCVFYHVIAESEEQCYALAEGAGYDVSGMELELERTNVRDELGNPYSPRIEEAMVH